MFHLNNLTSFHLNSPPLACYDNTASTFPKTVTAFIQVTLREKIFLKSQVPIQLKALT